MSDSFWDDLEIPFQEDEEGYQFANAVIVAQEFLKAIGKLSYEGQQAEDLTQEIAGLTLMLESAETSLTKLRRKIFAKHYKGIAKSASTEVRDAYIYNKAEEDGHLQTLTDLEDNITKLKANIRIKEASLEKHRSRIKILQTVRDWSKQYLDFDKLLIRSEL